MGSKIQIKFAKLIMRIVKYMGDTSVANCWGPYYQSTVPQSMKENKKYN